MMLLKMSTRINTINSVLIFNVEPQPHATTHIFSLHIKTINICVYYDHGIEVSNANSFNNNLKFCLKVQGQLLVRKKM